MVFQIMSYGMNYRHSQYWGTLRYKISLQKKKINIGIYGPDIFYHKEPKDIELRQK